MTHAPDLKRCMFLVGGDGDDGSGIELGMAAGGRRGQHVVRLDLATDHSAEEARDRNSRQRAGPTLRQRRFVLRPARRARDVPARRQSMVARRREMFRAARRAARDHGRGRERRGDRSGTEASRGQPRSPRSSSTIATRRTAKIRSFAKSREFVRPLEPPYAALDCCVDTSFYAAFTLGGLRTTVDSEVLRSDGTRDSGPLRSGSHERRIGCARATRAASRSATAATSAAAPAATRPSHDKGDWHPFSGKSHCPLSRRGAWRNVAAPCARELVASARPRAIEQAQVGNRSDCHAPRRTAGRAGRTT